MPRHEPTAVKADDKIIAEMAAKYGFTTMTTRYQSHYGHAEHSTLHVKVGTVTMPAFDEPRWRDLGEGPSWQEQYTLPMAVEVPLWWERDRYDGSLTIELPVTSLLRQGGAKWGGVSVASNNDTRPKASTHRLSMGVSSAREIAESGTFYGGTVRLEQGVSVEVKTTPGSETFTGHDYTHTILNVDWYRQRQGSDFVRYTSADNGQIITAGAWYNA